MNLIRERSDIDAEITFISHTMINLKGIKVGPSPHSHKKDVGLLKLIEASKKGQISLEGPLFIMEVHPLQPLQSGLGVSNLWSPSNHTGHMGRIRSP